MKKIWKVLNDFPPQIEEELNNMEDHLIDYDMLHIHSSVAGHDGRMIVIVSYNERL